MSKNHLSTALTSQVIRFAWEDRTSFEEIKKRTGLSEASVIAIMRRELKPSSFVMWRKRVNGRVTKHRKLLKIHLQSGNDVEGIEAS